VLSVLQAGNEQGAAGAPQGCHLPPSVCFR